jgi:hypothetical protein
LFEKSNGSFYAASGIFQLKKEAPLSTPAIAPTTIHAPSTIHLPQLSLIPNLSNILTSLLQLTGLQSVITLTEKTKALAQSGNYTPETVNEVIQGVQELLVSVGHYVPGGAFAQLEAEVAKYEAISAAIESGATTQVAEVIYTSKSGQHFTCALSLSIKG